MSTKGNLLEKGPSIGTYQQKPIPAYVVNEVGNRFEFDRIAKTDRDGCAPLSQLGKWEIVIAPGLIYRMKAPNA